MARTTESAVALAIDTDLSSAQITAFIDDASAFVDIIAAADSTIAAARLALIEKYLACHFVTLRDPRVKAALIADTSDTYQRDGEVTEYLKAAIALDPTHTIRDAFDDDKIGFRHKIGTGYDA